MGCTPSIEKQYPVLRPNPKYNYFAGYLAVDKRDPLEIKWLNSKPKTYINPSSDITDIYKWDIIKDHGPLSELEMLLNRLVDLNTTASIRYDWIPEIMSRLDEYFDRLSQRSAKSKLLTIELKKFVNKINEIGPVSFNIKNPKYVLLKKQLYYQSAVVEKKMSSKLHESWRILVNNIVWDLDRPFKH